MNWLSAVWPGIVLTDEKDKQKSCKIIETTPQQDAEFDQFIANYEGEYQLTGNNCVNFVRKALDLVEMKSSNTILPKRFFDSLNKEGK